MLVRETADSRIDLRQLRSTPATRTAGGYERLRLLPDDRMRVKASLDRSIIRKRGARGMVGPPETELRLAARDRAGTRGMDHTIASFGQGGRSSSTGRIIRDAYLFWEKKLGRRPGTPLGGHRLTR